MDECQPLPRSPFTEISATFWFQIEEIRKRMDVDITVGNGQKEAPPPIESFEDMNLSAKVGPGPGTYWSTPATSSECPRHRTTIKSRSEGS